MKHFVLILLLLLSNLFIFPAYASVCRNYDGHQICILSINRSAKNYWEYRAIVSVDGEKRPLEVYNCRQKVRIQTNGTVLPFENKDPGELICSFFKKPWLKSRGVEGQIKSFPGMRDLLLDKLKPWNPSASSFLL